MPQKCEFEQCELEAEGWVEARWSLFDFLRYEMCFWHLFEAQEELQKRRVEDFGTPWTAVRFYEPLIDWSETSTGV